ncbi:MAG: hypothetical protein KF752_04925 [Pirellulaceae bacterium]|nr:hypothetical protein [Pirellulaceae bacterium]
MIRSNGYYGRVALILVCAWLSLLSIAVACQVPVFRYALERWNPDRYRVLALSHGPLASDLAQEISRLSGNSDRPSVVDVQQVDITNTSDPSILELWKTYSQPDKAPILVTLYPKRSSLDQQAHACPLTAEGVSYVLNSPVRRELTRRLTDGQSAVWILVQSGDAQKDAQALNTLEQQLEADAQKLELPTADALEVEPQVLEQTKIKLRLAFSVITVSRQDPAEKFLIDCLLNSEEDLRDYPDEPIAFPVFGRGIVLYALVGKGIAGEVIHIASKFIIGPCSCQVKEQNPGFDLLLDFDWDAAVGSTLVSNPIPAEQSTPQLLTIPPGKKK